MYQHVITLAYRQLAVRTQHAHKCLARTNPTINEGITTSKALQNAVSFHKYKNNTCCGGLSVIAGHIRCTGKSFVAHLDPRMGSRTSGARGAADLVLRTSWQLICNMPSACWCCCCYRPESPPRSTVIHDVSCCYSLLTLHTIRCKYLLLLFCCWVLLYMQHGCWLEAWYCGYFDGKTGRYHW